MVIGITNIDKCLKAVKGLEIDLSKEFRDAGSMVQRDAKKLAPVNKDPLAPTRGNLRGSIRRSPLNGSYKNGASVGTNVEYAIYQEFGTYKMNAQPFLLPALKKNEKDILNMIKKKYELN
jgi:HK97 gp10 family phage protein